MSVKSALTAIADEFRLYLQEKKKYNLDEMPRLITDVYNVGWSEGILGGYDRGYDEGKQSEWNAFWDAFQDNGNRNDYNYAFTRWRDGCFKPKYDINVSGKSVGTLQGVFDTCQINRSLVDILNECGVSLKFVDCNNKALYNIFSYSLFTEIDFVLENSETARLNTIFYTCNNLKTARIIGLSETNTISQVVDKCPSLENFTIEGTIGQNGLNFQQSTKLSKASIENIIGCLSTTTSGLSVTLSMTAVTTAFGSADSEEWLALINTRANWTINLV